MLRIKLSDTYKQEYSIESNKSLHRQLLDVCVCRLMTDHQTLIVRIDTQKQKLMLTKFVPFAPQVRNILVVVIAFRLWRSVKLAKCIAIQLYVALAFRNKTVKANKPYIKVCKIRQIADWRYCQQVIFCDLSNV